MTLKYKRCSHRDCLTWYKNPQVYFHKDKNREDGFNVYCKVCVKKFSKEHYAKRRSMDLKVRTNYYNTSQMNSKEARLIRIQVIRDRLKQHWEDKGLL